MSDESELLDLGIFLQHRTAAGRGQRVIDVKIHLRSKIEHGPTFYVARVTVEDEKGNEFSHALLAVASGSPDRKPQSFIIRRKFLTEVIESFVVIQKEIFDRAKDNFEKRIQKERTGT